MTMVQGANLALRFLLEILVLLSVGLWGMQAGRGLGLRLILGMGAPLAVAAVWALFGAPKAAIPLRGVKHALVELAVFGSGVAALYAAGRTGAAGLLATAILLNRVLMVAWHQ